MTPRTDEALMSLYATAGDQRAFNELFRRLAPRINMMLLRLTNRRDVAEELTQVTFLKVHRARASYLVGAPVAPWVNAIARNVFLDSYRRSRSRRAEVLTHDGTLPEAREQPPEANAFDALGDATRGVIAETIATLPRSQREALLMLKVDGLSLREASARTGASVGAVKVRAHRAYTALREAVATASP